MIVDHLSPSLEILTQEYVLVQAWKKTAAYIRQHNWYSDTLGVDRASVNLPHFLNRVRSRLQAPTMWTGDPLRLVPAPKSQRWRVDPDTQKWQPVEKGKTGAKLRPLAHVSLVDQVAASAVMLCLADRIESRQGDTRASVSTPEERARVLSYGNRLFCDESDGRLYHRWGSGRLYRSYYQDYRAFLGRPEVVIKSITRQPGKRVFIVHSDLRQFYDRVRPDLLAEKLNSIEIIGDDRRFFDLAKRIFNWRWHAKDLREVEGHAKETNLVDFTSIALPQGLVAAGFFANVVLLDFDDAVRASFSETIGHGIRLEDACRYVDDLRITLVADEHLSPSQVEAEVCAWLAGLLNAHAPGLEPSLDKTRAALPDGDERPLVRQSRRMDRIQRAVSGGFDAAAGEEILSAVHGLVRAQERYSAERTSKQGWDMAPVADIPDARVARFAAARFRTTFRSLRPLLASDDVARRDLPSTQEEISTPFQLARSQRELDDEVRAFALGLVENWLEDPSNVRLLRIGLDLWPDPKLLGGLLEYLRPFTEKGGQRKAPRRVAWYCLAEILRAGATETGFVDDEQSLPSGVDLDLYRTRLADEAVRLLDQPSATLPWYLRQQALLFLAVHDESRAPITRSGSNSETRHYRSLIRFRRGERRRVSADEFATLAILCRRSFGRAAASLALASDGITAGRLEEVAARDPAFALELLEAKPEFKSRVSARRRDDLCLRKAEVEDGWVTLSDAILGNKHTGSIRNEPAILNLAVKLLESWPAHAKTGVVTPGEILVKFVGEGLPYTEIAAVKFVTRRVAAAGSIYSPPTWCPDRERWRFQLGYLLRFALRADQDFAASRTRPSWRDLAVAYRVPLGHWLQRRYAFFNGQQGLGDDWLPVSDWLEHLVSALLRWPGCRSSPSAQRVTEGIGETISNIQTRLVELKRLRAADGLLLLPIVAPDSNSSVLERPLRVCIVQTVIPSDADLDAQDLAYSSESHRRQHRNHLSAALAAVERMLTLRETHVGRDKRLDWLILPELSVHPKDVRTHLVPFARAHRSIVLAGLTYEELFADQPLVNSALWVIPRVSPDGGLEVITRRQGKQNLSPLEQKLNSPVELIQGFRPCQWLVGYRWSERSDAEPLWLSSAICYDATDLALTTALRKHSDVLAIPALNRDVGTFDHMALALHYHMFQMVMVVNNGTYGGSNAYMPVREEFRRQVFHLHGQPQASIAFLEIDDIGGFLKRNSDARNHVQGNVGDGSQTRWKFPPAGME